VGSVLELEQNTWKGRDTYVKEKMVIWELSIYISIYNIFSFSVRIITMPH
jgi:FtsH-binding integral membrane protein